MLVEEGGRKRRRERTDPPQSVQNLDVLVEVVTRVRVNRPRLRPEAEMTVHRSSGNSGEPGERVGEDDTVTAEEGADVRDGVGGFGGDVEGALPPAVVLGGVSKDGLAIDGSIAGLGRKGESVGLTGNSGKRRSEGENKAHLEVGGREEGKVVAVELRKRVVSYCREGEGRGGKETNHMPRSRVEKVQHPKLPRLHRTPHTVRQHRLLRVLQHLRQPLLKIGKRALKLRERTPLLPWGSPIDVPPSTPNVARHIRPDIGDPKRVTVDVCFRFRLARRKRVTSRNAPGWRVEGELGSDATTTGDEVGVRTGHAEGSDPRDFETAGTLVAVRDGTVEGEERPPGSTTSFGLERRVTRSRVVVIVRVLGHVGDLVLEAQTEDLRHSYRLTDLEPARVVATGGELVEAEDEETLAAAHRDGGVGGEGGGRCLSWSWFGKGEKLGGDVGVVFGCGGGGGGMEVAEGLVEAAGRPFQ